MELLQRGPLGVDQQLGAKISEGKIGVLIFFLDLPEPQLHNQDLESLIGIILCETFQSLATGPRQTS